MYCDKCGALGESCCDTARARQDTASILSRIVDRQTKEIKALTIERDTAQAVIRKLMADNAI